MVNNRYPFTTCLLSEPEGLKNCPSVGICSEAVVMGAPDRIVAGRINFSFLDLLWIESGNVAAATRKSPCSSRTTICRSHTPRSFRKTSSVRRHTRSPAGPSLVALVQAATMDVATLYERFASSPEGLTTEQPRSALKGMGPTFWQRISGQGSPPALHSPC